MTFTTRNWALGILSAASLALAGCTTAKDAENLKRLDVAFDWQQTDACSSKPPAFEVANIPEDTGYLSFELEDLDVPTYNHGGGTMKYTGQTRISAGAFSYKGPCPPSGEQHDYRWTVEALNAAQDTVLARGTATKPFPPDD